MSLSQQKLAANPPSLPTWTASNQLGQAMEPQYMYTSKQLPFMQLERLLDQLSSLSTFANTLFLDLANQTIMIQERLTKAGEQLKKIHDTIPQQVNEPKMGTRTPWTSDASMSSNLFVKATQPKSIKVLYDKCRQAPRLELLDQFRTDGKTCMELYSYPEFFVNEWKLWIEKEKVDRKKKRKEANQETLIDIQMPKAERARIKVETKEAAKHEQQLHFEAPKLAAPPPPRISTHLSTTTTDVDTCCTNTS
ncbi:hypothetical protein EDD86DRAFT_196470 [Gorgonomyces haynaldii]|nr:hypothetical protein EDD86DRAFT_196470 [Gorgonomyces haynaldii]